MLTEIHPNTKGKTKKDSLNQEREKNGTGDQKLQN